MDKLLLKWCLLPSKQTSVSEERASWILDAASALVWSSNNEMFLSWLTSSVQLSHESWICSCTPSSGCALAPNVNNGSSCHDTSALFTSHDAPDSPHLWFFSPIHTITSSEMMRCIAVTCVSALPAPLMSHRAPQQEFYWHYTAKNQSVIHWTKWTCGLWNHSKDVMMSYHRSVSAFIAIKHTDRVRGANMLTLRNGESCHSRVRMHWAFLPALIHLNVYFFRGCGHFH